MAPPPCCMLLSVRTWVQCAPASAVRQNPSAWLPKSQVSLLSRNQTPFPCDQPFIGSWMIHVSPPSLVSRTPESSPPHLLLNVPLYPSHDECEVRRRGLKSAGSAATSKTSIWNRLLRRTAKPGGVAQWFHPSRATQT